MQDDDGSTPAPGDDEAERAEALSRAARQAVRQPADPRLEQSFARLGLFGDDAPERPPRPGEPVRPARPDSPGPATAAPSITVAPAAVAVDLAPVLARLGDVIAATERIERRVGQLAAVVVGLAIAVAVLALLVLVRP